MSVLVFAYILYGLSLIFAGMVLLGAAWYLYSWVYCGKGKFAPYVQTCGKIKTDILNEARSVLKNAKTPIKVYDLGSGDGTLLIPLAKEFPNHTFIGFEWDNIPLKMAQKKASGLKNIHFYCQNFMEASVNDAGLILCYVLKCQGDAVGAKLATELKANVPVIAEKFPLQHLKEIKKINSAIYGFPAKVFIYQKKKKA